MPMKSMTIKTAVTNNVGTSTMLASKQKRTDLAEIRERRRRLVAAVTSRGLADAAVRISRLNRLLNRRAVDMNGVISALAASPEICELVRMIVGMEVLSVDQIELTTSESIVLFGSHQLRALALACSFLKVAARSLPPAERNRFWQHSFLAAILSERTARQVGYGQIGQAYLGGLLHDIGRLPLLIVACQEEGAEVPWDERYDDDSAAERDYFGVDHCAVGRSIAMTWNLPESLLDAINHHHSAVDANHDPTLAEIVASADQLSNVLLPETGRLRRSGSAGKRNAVEDLLRMCTPRLFEEEAVIEAPSESFAGDEIVISSAEFVN